MTARPLKSEAGLVDQLLLRGRDGIDHGWQQDAACAGNDPEAWFPLESGRNRAEVAYAKSICATCPARNPCAEYAIESGERHGVWGGLTVRDRDRIRRQRGLSGLGDVA